jgi:uncharacterized protein (TIGR02453 family)
MVPRFPGFPPEGIAFLRALKKHNTREWFQPRKDIFESKVKAPMLELVTAVMRALDEFAPHYVRDPNKAIFRIYRDTRFSKDKTPYKTHIAAVFPRRGAEKDPGSGYYFSVSGEEVAIGGGVYMPPPESLLAIRRYLAEHYEEFRKITAGRKVRRLFGEMTGASLSRAPKGFPANHPAGDLLRRKQFLLFKTLDSSLATSPKLYSEIVKRFEAITPFLAFLDRPLQKATPSQSGRSRGTPG